MDPVNAAIELKELGTIGVLLIVLFWILYFASKFLLAKMGGNATTHTVCLDPLLKQRVKEIHDYTEDVQHKIDQGDFHCVWEGRDEVRDFKDIMNRNADATEALTKELRITRNGKGRSGG